MLNQPKDLELAVTVQEDVERPGRVCQFRLDYGFNVTPAFVQSTIRAAILAGWDPTARGPAYQLEVA